MIELYPSPTPNGWKVSMGLEEMQVEYEPHIINLATGEQNPPEFGRCCHHDPLVRRVHLVEEVELLV